MSSLSSWTRFFVHFGVKLRLLSRVRREIRRTYTEPSSTYKKRTASWFARLLIKTNSTRFIRAHPSSGFKKNILILADRVLFGIAVNTVARPRMQSGFFSFQSELYRKRIFVVFRFVLRRAVRDIFAFDQFGVKSHLYFARSSRNQTGVHESFDDVVNRMT